MAEFLLMIHESASVRVALRGRQATVSSLNSTDRGKGHASELMRQLCLWADEQGIRLDLVAQSYGRVKGLTTPQLVMFYTKFGFELVNPPTGRYHMSRKSQDSQRV